MEENNRWVEDRLAKLNPDADWHPSVAGALARCEDRHAGRPSAGGWLRLLAVVAIAMICVLTFPQPRALAARVMAPCVEACENLVSTPVDFHYRIHRMIWSLHSWMHLTAPDFALTDSKGDNFQLSDYAGKVVLLNFWATWCRPCSEEIPWFIEFQREHESEGFAVIGVSVDQDGWKAVKPVMESLKINYRVAIANGDVVREYGGIESLPFSLLIDPDGRPVFKHVGITSKNQFEKAIARALEASSHE